MKRKKSFIIASCIASAAIVLGSVGSAAVSGPGNAERAAAAAIVEAADTVLKVAKEAGTVSNGDTATLSIQGKPNTKYRITVYYFSGPSRAQGLKAAVSDDNGEVSWSWKVGTMTAEGEHRIVISGGGEKIETSFRTIE